MSNPLYDGEIYICTGYKRECGNKIVDLKDPGTVPRSRREAAIAELAKFHGCMVSVNRKGKRMCPVCARGGTDL